MERIWWEQVPNARLYIDKITDRLVGQKSLILQHSSPFPWYPAFLSTVKDAVKRQNASKAFVTVDGDKEPGSYLLESLCGARIRAQYRPRIGHAAFLATNNETVLHERFVWVEISSEDQLQKWVSFVTEYLGSRPNGQNRAVFILNWQGSGRIAQSEQWLEILSYDSIVGEYDHLIFAMMASASLLEGTTQKNYLAEMLVQVLEQDVELYLECLKRCADFLKSPYTIVRDICEGECRGTGEAYTFSKTEDEVGRAVWAAQIKTVYHILEEYRENFVSRHKNAIAAHLPIENLWGDEYKEPGDVELGALRSLVRSNRLVLTSGEAKRLEAFWDARNKLSHLTALTYEEVRFLVN